MKNAPFILTFVLTLGLNACNTKIQKANDNDSPTLAPAYFGEKPPGLIPKVFAPAIVSPEGLFEGGKFSPDKKAYYFSRKNGKYEKRTFFIIRSENGRWGNESETDIKWPKFSSGGDTIYSGNKYRERTETGWSEYKSLGPPFTDKHIMGISVSGKKTFFFDQFAPPDTIGAISYSRLINGKYEPRQKMGKEINTGTWIAHPNIAPDESYLIWDVVRADGFGGSDIYISFRQEDGSWLPAVNMGDKINTPFDESGARVTDDGKYLFFSRGEWEVKEDGSTNWVGKSYWVDAQIIEQLRPKNNEKRDSTSYPIAYGSKGICLTNIEGTSKIRLTTGDNGYPAWSPDGKRIAMYAYHDGKKTWSIHTMNSDGTNRKRLTHAKNKWDSTPSWSPDGKKIVFAREYKNVEGVWQFEIWIMNSDGSGQTQIKSLKGSNPFFTPDGRIIFCSAFKDKKSGIRIADVDGNNMIQLTDNEADEWHPKVSPNGQQVAFSSDRDGNREIYVMNIDGSNQKRLTFNNGPDGGPSWSPDGAQLVFLSHRHGEKGIYRMNKDGSSVKKIIANGWQPAWLKIHQSNNQDKLPVLEGPYLGQKPPGLIPEVFAPGGLSTAHRDGNGFFTPDMKEFYFTRRSFKDGKWSLVVFKSENNRWRESVVGPRVGRPIITPDGKIMHLGKHYMERTKTGWSEIKSLGPMFDREDWGIMRLSASAKGTYVFDDAKNNDVIRISAIKDGKREEPKLLSKKINTGKWTAHPFIAPDESYLMWDSEREGGYGDSDLYISFRQKDGSWGTAINLGDTINTSAWEGGAYVTPDGKYLFFNRYISEKNAGMYWVDAKIIETLNPQ